MKFIMIIPKKNLKVDEYQRKESRFNSIKSKQPKKCRKDKISTPINTQTNKETNMEECEVMGYKYRESMDLGYLDIQGIMYAYKR